MERISYSRREGFGRCCDARRQRGREAHLRKETSLETTIALANEEVQTSATYWFRIGKEPVVRELQGSISIAASSLAVLLHFAWDSPTKLFLHHLVVK